MKRIPLIGLALLMILLSLVGCKDSPNDNPGGRQLSMMLIQKDYHGHSKMERIQQASP